MRRLNPKTNQPFKRGEQREDGKVFWQYVKKTIRDDGFFAETWITTETFNTHSANQKIAKKEHQKTKYGHLVKMIGAIRHRAKKKNIPFDIDVEYLELIAIDCCPIFHTVFDWGLDKKGNGKNRPSLDRIIPELGYVKGNVAFISKWANIIKSDATEKELYAIADWLHEARKNVKENRFTHLSERADSQSSQGTKRRTLSTARIRKDGDDFDHHSGAVHRLDVDHSAQASSGDSMGSGDKEVGTFEASFSYQTYGVSCPAVEEFILNSGYIPDKS